MKITRRQLRRLIREMAWDPKSASMHPRYADLGMDRADYDDMIDDGEYPDTAADLRVVGLLPEPQAEKEKELLFDYHKNHKKEIKKFHQELMKKGGGVTCLHSPGYSGAVTNKSITNIFDWISSYGKQGNNQISTVMFPCTITDVYKMEDNIDWSNHPNSSSLFFEPSIYLGGYPVIMSYRDEMTQTLTALHPDLVDFQKSSGVSKSMVPENKGHLITNYQDFISKGISSDETVLDNWFVKGIHINTNSMDDMQMDLSAIKQKCKEMKIDLYLTDQVFRKTELVR